MRSLGAESWLQSQLSASTQDSLQSSVQMQHAAPQGPRARVGSPQGSCAGHAACCSACPRGEERSRFHLGCLQHHPLQQPQAAASPELLWAQAHLPQWLLWFVGLSQAPESPFGPGGTVSAACSSVDSHHPQAWFAAVVRVGGQVPAGSGLLQGAQQGHGMQVRHSCGLGAGHGE